jgi:transposase
LADKAYSSKANRAYLRRRGIKAVIPENTDQAAARKRKGSKGGRPVDHDAELHKKRNTAERCFGKLKQWRGIATRADKLSESYEAGLLRTAGSWRSSPVSGRRAVCSRCWPAAVGTRTRCGT